ncbi:MAG: DegT/DnrJ/EryC1/StrS family aminotransferase [Planctomycetota bacterium]|nr:DegT/DnrJ/EryC1/StrS family aminotransferase [Planctomycetota bacterium]
MKVKLVDLKAQYELIRDEIEQPLLEFLQEQYFILGPTVEAFEAAVADYFGVSCAVGVSGGSDALLVALMALGIGEGDEVVTSSYTFFATAGAISRLGAKPVFTDIEPRTFNLSASGVERSITEKTKAIIPVHLFGQCAPLNEILDIGEKHGIPVIEDAAQSMGATYDDKQSGSLGLMGCTSFFPSKNLGGFGDGGMVVTNDEELGAKLKVLRGHGSKPKYHHKLIGGNFRLDAIQAFFLHKKLPHLGEWLGARKVAAATYTELFSATGLIANGLVRVPEELFGRHTFNQYVIRTTRRDQLMEHLGEKGVDTAIYYPIPLHLQECFQDLGYKAGDLPESERAAKESLALPICPAVTKSAQEYVVECIQEFHA